MSTRGFVGFVADDTEKIAYCHSDSYPEGLGCAVLGWLRSDTADDLTKLREQVLALRLVADFDEVPTDEEIERLSRYLNRRVGERSERVTWYQLLRETQGNPGRMLDAGVIEDASEFPLDSLFAEWGYVVDLDAETFEVYRGFQQQTHADGRFALRRSSDATSGYYPCRLVATWPLRELPDKPAFLARLEH